MSYIQLRDPLYFESNRCLIADPMINFDVDDIHIRNQLFDPLEMLNESDRNCAVLLDNIANSSSWIVFVKLNSNYQPINITLITEDMFGDAYPETLDRDIYNWEEAGMIHAENNITLVDFNHFEDDDLIIDLQPDFILEHPNRCINPWFNYVTDLGMDKERQGCVECFPYGLIANNLDLDIMIYPVEVCRFVDGAIYAIRLHIGNETIQTNPPRSTNLLPDTNHRSIFNIFDIKDNYLPASATASIPIQNISQLHQTNLEDFFRIKNLEEGPRVNSTKLKEL